MSSFNELSDAEQALVDDFVRKSAGKGDHLPEGPVKDNSDLDEKSVEEAFVQIQSVISDTDPHALRVLTLKRLKREIESKYGSIISPPKEMPADPKITREDLNRLLIKDEVTNYLLLVGGMIEELSIDLVHKEVIIEDRQSSSQRKRIEHMTQSEREELLYITGIIDSGEKSEIGRAYGMRNNLAHNANNTTVTNVLDDVNGDMTRAYNAVEILHKKLYGIDLSQRFSNLLVDDPM